MAKKILSIVETAYRATLEEQDDTVVWLTHAMKGAGAEIDVLLRGPAANYVVEGQEAAPMAFGGRAQKCVPDVHGQVATLIEKGARVFVVEEDLKRRGLAKAPRLRAATVTAQAQLPQLLAQYDQVWHW